MNSHDNLSTSAEHPTKPAGIHANPGPTAELTALAAHLRRLSERLDQLEADHAASFEQLATLNAHIQQLATPPATSPSPINWPALNADQALNAWENLATWIAHVLVPWYDTTRDQLPDCWPLHKPAVMELSWLHATHTEAFQPNSAAHQAADWHTRWRPAALHRLHEIIPRRGVRQCGPGHHLIHPNSQNPHRPQTLPPGPVPANPPQLPGEQLAERQHWQPFLDQAIATDHT